MKSLITRNPHQAFGPLCGVLAEFGADDGPALVTPVPISVMFASPLERVVRSKDLSPMATLLSAANDLVDQFPHMIHGARTLKEKPDTRVHLIAEGCYDTGHAIIQRNSAGKLDMIATGARVSIHAAPRTWALLSMVLEYVSNVSGLPCGALWHVMGIVECGRDDLGLMRDRATDSPADAYEAGTTRATIPMMSLPANRWMRELEQFTEQGDAVAYLDPFIQNVLVPMHRAQRQLMDQAPMAQIQRTIGEVASQDWMTAALDYTTEL